MEQAFIIFLKRGELIMENYTYRWKLLEDGYTEVPFKEWEKIPNDNVCKEKDKYVNHLLSPAVRELNCGWKNVVYKIFKNKFGYYEEYVVISNDTLSDRGRYINVTGCSLAAIAHIVFNNIW